MSSVPSPPPSDSSSSTRSSTRANDGVPLGLWIIVGVAFLGALLRLFTSLALIGEGVGAFGVLLLTLTALEVVVLVGLLGLRYWAFALALLVYGFSALLSLLTGEPLSFIVSVVIIGYLLLISGRFE